MSATIKYNGKTVTITDGDKAILECSGIKMRTDLEVSASGGGSGGGDGGYDKGYEDGKADGIEEGKQAEQATIEALKEEALAGLDRILAEQDKILGGDETDE